MQINRLGQGTVVAACMVAVGGMIVWNKVSTARRRERRLRSNEIRGLRSTWITVAGNTMHARVAIGATDGQSLPVVLVHGFGISSSYFVPAAERLGTEFTVYAPDLPGHGKSSTPRQPLDVPGLADSLIGWMDQIGLRRVSMIGNSMGCQVAVDAAVRYSDRVDRLVLIGPTTDPVGRTVIENARRLILAAPYERLSLMKLLARDYARMGIRLFPELRAMLRDPIEEKLPLVSAPVMLVRGAKDPIVTQRWVDEAARLVRATEVVVIPNWGHAVHHSAAWQVADAIAPFLRAASPLKNH